MKKRGCFSIFKKTLIGFLILFIFIFGGIALYNQTLPTASLYINTPGFSQQALLSEAGNLRESLGNKVWPGWGDDEIPLVVYNESYAFLFGIENPARGWKQVPGNEIIGGMWEDLPEINCYRQPLPASGETPQAFIVQVGDQFAASMTTRDWMKIRTVKMIQKELPDFLTPFIPYTIFLSRLNSDWYISAILHESFHVLQAKSAYDKLKKAEAATSLEQEYLWNDPDFREKWLKERRLLAEVLETNDLKKLKELGHRWLNLRTDRRKGLPKKLIQYEKEREWLEGLAKYAELKIWMNADQNENYKPVPEMDKESDFNDYNGYEAHRDQEITTLKSDLQFDEVVFYYSGWAQAELLDHLKVNWKSKAMAPDIYLDDLIAEELK